MKTDNLQTTGSHSHEEKWKCPLHRWTTSIEKITLVSKEKDLKVAYRMLISTLDRLCYGNKLKEDKTLFIV